MTYQTTIAATSATSQHCNIQYSNILQPAQPPARSILCYVGNRPKSGTRSKRARGTFLSCNSTKRRHTAYEAGTTLYTIKLHVTPGLRQSSSTHTVAASKATGQTAGSQSGTHNWACQLHSEHAPHLQLPSVSQHQQPQSRRPSTPSASLSISNLRRYGPVQPCPQLQCLPLLIDLLAFEAAYSTGGQVRQVKHGINGTCRSAHSTGDMAACCSCR